MANDKLSIVYIAVNRVNGKRYIGVTCRGLSSRKRQHESDAFNPRFVVCKAFHAAIRKYGKDAFEWSILETFPTREEGFKGEYEIILRMKPEYNLTHGGVGCIGYVRSAESNLKQSIAMRGRTLSPEAIAKIVAKNKGRKRTPEQRKRMGDARKGKPFSEAHRANLSKATTAYFARLHAQMEATNG